MSEEIITNLILYIQQHPVLALFTVFIVAFSESLIVIGLIVPGAVLMIFFGALISMEALEFWPTVFFAVAGAISGDSLSYWLGKRYQTSLHNLWPLSRHPEAITKANLFFNLHGAKSIIFSRFIGPLRPVIPAIAGITQMPLKIFIMANVSSAFIWAPLYLLPGLLFGLSIEIASEFASKFIFLILFLLFIIIVILWILQRFYIFTKPYNEKAVAYLLNWGEKHPIAGKIPAAIFDKQHPELQGLSLVALILFMGTLTLSLLHSTTVATYIPFFYNFDSLDQLVYNSLQAFRSPPFDNIMLWLNFLTSSEFIALLCFSLGLLFIAKNNFFSLWHWLAAITLPLLLSPLLANDLTSSLQENINININIQSLHFVVIVSTFGFLTILLSSGFTFRIQRIIYYFTSSFTIFLILSQLYFASQVFSQILFSVVIGLTWFNLLGIAYRRHIKKNINTKTRKQILLIILTLLIYPSWKTIQQEDIHIRSDKYFVMGTDSWIESGWKLLPIMREGLYPNKSNLFNLQWPGTEKQINLELSQAGFSSMPHTSQTFSNWFIDDAEIYQLPVLPHIHKGEYETLRFYKYNHNHQQLAVIRLWPSIYQLKQETPLHPLWFGSINFMKVRKNLGITYLVTTKEQKQKTILKNSKNLIIHEKNTGSIKEKTTNTIYLVQPELKYFHRN